MPSSPSSSNPLRLNLPLPARWYQFKMRTLLIGVALLSIAFAYVVRQNAIVRERQTMLEFGDEKPCVGVASFGGIPFISDEIPPVRRLLGDRGCFEIDLRADISRAVLEHYKAVFPEAHIIIMPDRSDL